MTQSRLVRCLEWKTTFDRANIHRRLHFGNAGIEYVTVAILRRPGLNALNDTSHEAHRADCGTCAAGGKFTTGTSHYHLHPNIAGVRIGDPKRRRLAYYRQVGNRSMCDVITRSHSPASIYGSTKRTERSIH